MSDTSFKPAWWLPGPHLQTLWPALCRWPIKKINLEKERFELPDGDFVDLSWIGKNEKGPIILVLHGLEGSVRSPYAHGMLHTIQQRGWRAVFMHFRGCSGEPNRLNRGYHSGETSDVAYLVESIHRKEPTTPIAAVGYSLGGNVLLKWLGETQQKNPLVAAVAVSVPFELHKSADRIKTGFSKIYQKFFLLALSRRLKRQFLKTPVSFPVPPLNTLKTLWEFDDKVTAPMHGFLDVHDYYLRASSRQYLKDIYVPTLLIHAKDDPFTTHDVIPEKEEMSECVELEVTNTGGHVGFVSGRAPWKARYWLEDRVPGFLEKFF